MNRDIFNLGIVLFVMWLVAWLVGQAFGVDLADAATAVAGGENRLGEGVQDAGATVEGALVGYVGPIASIGGGLAAAFATKSAGGGMGGSVAAGLGSALGISFIPIAGTTTYQTSGSSGADWGALGHSVSAMGDGFVWLSVALTMTAIVLWKEARSR